VTITDNKKNAATVRDFLILLIGSILLLSGFADSCFAQTNKSDVELMFVKSNDSIKSSDLYFNVLKIWNNTPKRITGNLSFNGPEDWKIITFPSEQIILTPGDTVSVPIRISPVANALGGVAYIINATFRTSKQFITTSTYLTLPSIVKWDFSINRNNAYFTENNPNATFQIRLSNKGNTNELIKLKLNAGKLLAFTDNSPNNALEFVSLRAFSDTTILRTLTTQSKISFAEKLRYENNWKESAINITASSEQVEKNAAIQIFKLNSTYVNQRAQTSSPLNVDYQIYNLMSNQTVRHNAKVYGSLLFPENREIQYVAGVQNFNVGNTTERFDINRQLLYNIRYTDNHNNIQLGYNINGGSLHSVNGRGVSGVFRINPRNSVSYAVTQNPYSNTIGEFIGFSSSFKKLSLNTEVTHESKIDGSYQATSGLVGAGFTLFKHHFFSLQLLGSKSDYKKTLLRDTSVLGFSYRINYSVNYKKFSLRFNTLNSEHNYILNSGLQQSYLDSKYIINDKVGLTLYGNRQKYAITRFPYNFYNPVNYNSNDNLRLTTSLTAGNLIYQLGPNYNGSMRQYYNSITGYKSEYLTYQPGLWCAVSIKFDGYRSFTPNLTVSNIRFYYKSDDPSVQSYSFDKNLYYSAGVSYFDNVWRVNAYYTSGSTTDMYRSVLVDAKPTVSRSIQFRPSYENYFFNRKVKLSSYVNYAYYMPSGRENVSFNVKYDQFFKNGWNLSVSGFMYTNTRVDEQQGRVSTKDINLLIGVTKSFNIQQPRLKYYDFKTIFFNDLDGNRIKTDNEPPVTDILVSVEKDQSIAPGSSNIPEIKLIADANGAVAIENLPKDNYKLSFTPLLNLQSLYFLDGSDQPYFNDKTRTVYIPLAESYKIKGKIILVRDPNSSEGKIEVGGVRITVTGQKGETYSVLTDNFGAFLLSVPKADKYTVHINNVFGEQFNIDTNEMQVQFTQNKTINVDFTFIEKKRGIQFEGGSQFFNFNSMDTESTEKEIDSKSVESASIEPEQSYAIQLGALKIYREPSYFKNKYKLKDDVLYTENDGVYKYYTGNYPTLKDAKSAIAKFGLTAIPVAVDRSTLKEAKPAEKIQPATTPTTPTGLKKVEPKSQPVVQKNEAVSTSQSTLENRNNEVVKPKPVIMQSAPVKTETTASQAATMQTTVVDDKKQSIVAQPVTVPAKQETATQLKHDVTESAAHKTSANKSTQAASIQPTDKNRNTVKPQSGDERPVSVKQDVPVKQQAEANQSTVVKSNTVDKKQSSSAQPVPAKTETGIQQKPVFGETAASKTVSNSNSQSASIQSADKNTAAAKTQPAAQPASVKQNVQPKPQVWTNQPITAKGNTIEKSQPVILQPASSDKKYLYTIQLDASKIFRDPNYYKNKFGLPFDVVCVEKEGVRKYYAGSYESIDAAKADIARYGMTGFIVSIEESGMK
jgi:hypothetical protein